jgi:pimeloyl-ACP methyl ester carboxylesterase
MSIARLEDADIYFEVHGDGPPMVFVHGASGSHLSWWRQAPFFSQRYSCVIYDQRGFGRSAARGDYEAADANALGRDLKGLMAHLGFDRDIVLLGNSLGTLPVLDFACSRPEQVAALILSGGYGGLRSAELAKTDEARKALFARYNQSLAAGETPRVRMARVQSKDETARFPALHQPFGPMGERMVREQPELAFLYAELALISNSPPISELAKAFDTVSPVAAETAAALPFPVMCIGGAEDPVFPPDCLKAAAACFARATHVSIPHSGHSVYFENPERFNAAVDEFLSRTLAR